MFEPFAEVPAYPLVFPVFWGAAAFFALAMAKKKCAVAWFMVRSCFWRFAPALAGKRFSSPKRSNSAVRPNAVLTWAHSSGKSASFSGMMWSTCIELRSTSSCVYAHFRA